METAVLRVQATLLCVAINAAPLIAERLLSANTTARGELGTQRDVIDVLETHGGDRFGEKDNSSELTVLGAWLKDTAGEQSELAMFSPSLYELLKVLWLRLDLDVGFMLHVDASGCCYNSAHQVEEDLGRRTTTLDFYNHLDDSTKRDRKAQLTTARKQYDDAKAVLCSVGVPNLAASCTEIAESFKALNRWTVSPDAAVLLSQPTHDVWLPPQGTADTLTTLLAQEDVWESIVERTDKLMAAARCRRDSAERTERYVLRAFVVDNGAAADNARRKVSVVRRFGKSSGPSHYSILDAGDGICQPTRAQDIKGTVIESVWVCCNDDVECKSCTEEAADGTVTSQGGGLNTVVADPDDEIFCRVCHDLESWGYNQIIICDGCELGVHQMCHVPIVTESDLTLDQWYCSNCMRADRSDGATKRQRTD
ncbi:mitochondrial transcription factor 2 [Coemansia sp. RSA 1843]|nr:mitochondrial transcription factor 2 [Coemansia sp. RSA 1843]